MSFVYFYWFSFEDKDFSYLFTLKTKHETVYLVYNGSDFCKR